MDTAIWREKRLVRAVPAVVIAVIGAAFANAGSIILDGLGGAVLMHSRDFNGGGVFGAGSPQFTNDAMTAVTNDLKADGIQVDRVVTFLLADTDDGLAFLTIVDDITQTAAGKEPTELQMTTTGPDSAGGYINDAGEDIDQYFDPPTGTQTFAGHFSWNAARQADGFGWSRLVEGDFVSFNFVRGGPSAPSHPGLRRSNTFQFVSWDGDSWSVVATGGFTARDQFAFSFTVIPLPAPALLGLAGIATLAVCRRRRRSSHASL